MSTEEQQPKVLYAAMLASAILTGCATLAAPSDSQQRLTAYLAKAQSQVDECVATARRMLRPPPGLRADRADGGGSARRTERSSGSAVRRCRACRAPRAQDAYVSVPLP